MSVAKMRVADLMQKALLTEREQLLFEEQLAPWTPFCDDPRRVLEFTRAFVETLPWSVVAEYILPLCPAGVRHRILRQMERWPRLVRMLAPLFPARIRRRILHEAYDWPRLIGMLAPDEVAPFAAALVPVLHKLGMHDVQRRYAEASIDRLFGDFIAAVNEPQEDWRTVVFITSRTDYKPLREAIALRRERWRCFLICLEPLPPLVRPMFEEAFDVVLPLPFEPALLELLVRRLRPDVLHVHCAMWHYHLGRIVIDQKGDAVCACEFNDITSFYADRKVMSDYWSADLIDRDWAMERYICNNADLVIHQWDPGMEAHWRATHGGVAHVIEMQPYAIDEWICYAEDRPSKHDGILRLVWAGQIPGRIACPPVVFDAYYLGEAIAKLLEQGFGVEAYQNPMFTTNFDDPNFTFYRELSERFPRFAIKPGVRLDLLPKTLVSYDFGLILFDVPFHRACTPPAKTRYLMTNKLSTYFEAGIPVIVNWEYESMADFVTENGFGIALRTDEIEHAMDHVRRFDRAAAVERIKRYSREHSMHVEIKRLIAAYGKSARELHAT